MNKRDRKDSEPSEEPSHWLDATRQDEHIPHDPTQDPSGPEPTEQPDRQAMPVDREEPPKLPFPVVGIGASAGGLEAMSEFLTAMRPDSGMAFVFIQHLPPEHESHLADILSKKTEMLVQQVEEGMTIKPDHVYVIRPGHVLTMKDGRLHLGAQLGKRAANRPVDDFFKSLAEEMRERGIGVILSGMGSNGSAGAQAIKAVGGLCVAQDPETTAYPSMPRHLIDQGYADYILAPADIPEILLQYAGHPYARSSHVDAEEQLRRDSNHLREILAMLRTRTHNDFNGYKKPTVIRRIQRRMGLARMTDMGEYAKLVRQSPGEVTALADDLLIHVTGFFRDTQAWDAMHKHVIAPLIARREPNAAIRAWVTACSSGEEAYTLAMLLLEEAERAEKPLSIKVFATDMASRPLQQARAGVFPGGIETEIDPQRLEKFFDREDSVYRIKPHVRECVVFAPQNVLQDPPFSQLDIVSCRNLLIYLEPEVQTRVLSLLHFGLREGGALFLGSSETVGASDGMYEVIDKKARIFRRVGPTRRGMMDFVLPPVRRGAEPTARIATPVAPPPEPRNAARSIANLTARTLLENHVPGAVTVDRDNNVVHYHGNVRNFIEQPAGEPTRDLFRLAREGLRGSIRVALHRCAAEHAPVTLHDGWIESEPGEQARIAVTASPLWTDDGANNNYFVVSFERLDQHGGDMLARELDADLAAGQLRRVRDELETTVEELQASNEELKASNEEVISINEELQSTNEELETSKEEMQSLNEELVTVNAQLHVKMEESQTANNDLTALISSTDIGVVFLDTRFAIRRYTPAVNELIDVIPGDIGRPLADLRWKFDDPHLDSDVHMVLQKLSPIEREVSAPNGKHYARRILPYRTTDNRIDGVVMTFVDVTERKRAEQQAVAAREYAESIVETLHEPLLVLKPDLTVHTANAAFFRHFNAAASDTIGRRVYELGNRQWNIPDLRRLLEEVLPQNKVFNGFEVTHDFEELGRRVMLLNARKLDHVELILLGFRDVTIEHELSAAARSGERRMSEMLNIEGVSILTFDRDMGGLIDVNDQFLKMTGYSRREVASRSLTWQTLTAPEYIDAGDEQRRQLAKSGRVGPYEKQYLHKNGLRSWMLCSAARMEDGTIVEYCIDIAGRKRAEIELLSSEQRFRLIVDNVRDYAILTADPEGKITSWNPGAQRIFGYEEKEVLGENAAMLFTPEDRAAGEHAKELETARRTGRASDDRWQMRKGGDRFWATGVTSALRNAEGATIGFVKILRDETDRKVNEEAMSEARSAAETSSHMKDHFLAIISHELRTPLSAILLWAKMINRGRAGPDQIKEGMLAIERSAEAQKQLIEDLLDISRITAGKLRLDLRDVSIGGVIESAVEATQPAATAKDIRITTQVADADAMVLGDPDRLQQVFWNLLANAVKFTPEGGQVAISTRREGRAIEVAVTDNGRGFDPQRAAGLFIPFVQVEDPHTRTQGGLGLGLSIVSQLVELQGGTVNASSPGVGKGATFTVRLPLSRGTLATTRPGSAAGKSIDLKRLSRLRVLLVEDDQSTRDALGQLMKSAKMEVVAAGSVAEAMVAFDSWAFDLIVSDISMPDADGFTLIRQIRAVEAKAKKRRRTPALALTAFTREEDRARALDAGFHSYVTKPIEDEQFLAAMVELLTIAK